MLTADCTPILFAEPEARVVGAAHAGWKGAKAGIIGAVVEAMEALGAQRDRICAAIGPTISRAAYEVGPEFEEGFLAENAANAKIFHARGDRMHGRISTCRPIAGTGRCRRNIAHVDGLGLCTYQNESLFFSYRRSTHRAEADYGRQISAIVIM